MLCQVQLNAADATVKYHICRDINSVVVEFLAGLVILFPQFPPRTRVVDWSIFIYI